MVVFNEINMILHLPFELGLYFEGDNEEEVKYQAAHHQLGASAAAKTCSDKIQNLK